MIHVTTRKRGSTHLLPKRREDLRNHVNLLLHFLSLLQRSLDEPESPSPAPPTVWVPSLVRLVYKGGKVGRRRHFPNAFEKLVDSIPVYVGDRDRRTGEDGPWNSIQYELILLDVSARLLTARVVISTPSTNSRTATSSYPLGR